MPEIKSGGFTAARKVSVRDYEVFRRAFLNGPIGITYTPLTCMTQVVNGTNYIFGAQEDIIIENGSQRGLVVVSIFEEPVHKGGGVYIKSIKRPSRFENDTAASELFAGLDTAVAGLSYEGGYTDFHPLNERDKAVFERAVAHGPVGVSFEPYEVATQVVSGTNFCFNCNAKTVAAEPREYKVHMYVFEALQCYGGAVEITSIEEF